MKMKNKGEKKSIKKEVKAKLELATQILNLHLHVACNVLLERSTQRF